MTISKSSAESSTEEQLTLFVEDTHVSHSPKLGSKKAIRMTATSGRRCIELLSSADPLGLLLKTLLVTSEWGSTKCLLTWKTKATPQGRLLFQLVPSMLTTEETECGLLPTMRSGLTGHITPERKNDKNRNLEKAIAEELFPAPTANRRSGLQSHGRNAILGPLNPIFVEWLMGFPEGWTDLEH